mgnify:CR=1 FL=1
MPPVPDPPKNSRAAAAPARPRAAPSSSPAAGPKSPPNAPISTHRPPPRTKRSARVAGTFPRPPAPPKRALPPEKRSNHSPTGN